jgi:hypothetical protein
MAIEAQSSAAVEAFYTDSFDLGASLADLYRSEMHSLQHEAGEEPLIPIPIYAMHHKLYTLVPGIWIKPEAFHQAHDMSEGEPSDVTDEVIKTATAHYEQLRGFGMKVVGHLFEPIPEDLEGFQTNSRYPTVLAGAKSRTEAASANPTLVDGTPSDIARYVEDLASIYGKTLSEDAIGDLGITSNDLEKAIIAPVREYYAWCRTENEAYVLSGLDLSHMHNYTYHPVGHIGLTEVTTTLASVELGNLDSSERSFQRFADALQAAA